MNDDREDDRSWRTVVKLIPLWMWFAVFAPIVIGALVSLGVLK